MYLLRRTATRAISAKLPTTIFTRPRSITTCSPIALRARQPQWTYPFQRRFASDEATKAEGEAAEEANENFAQTATEAPADESIEPIPEAPQADSTDAAATVGADALDAAAAKSAQSAQSRPVDGSAPTNTLYVGNLYYEVGEDQLKRVFSRFGPIDKVTIVHDNRGLSRGFGYVDFQNRSDAQAAIENLDMQVFEGRNLVVQMHRPKNRETRRSPGQFQENPPSKTLFIGNMSFEMSDKDLNDLFRDIRNVMDVRVAIDRRTGQPRGFAHADFIDVASATAAREVLKEKVIYNRQLRVDFSAGGSQQQRRSAPTSEL